MRPVAENTMRKLQDEKTLSTKCTDLANELYKHLTRLQNHGYDWDKQNDQYEINEVAKKINSLVKEGWIEGVKVADGSHVARNGLTPNEEKALRQAIDEIIPTYTDYHLEWETNQFGSDKFADRVLKQMAGYGKTHIIYGIVSCLRFRQHRSGKEIQSLVICEIRDKIVARFQEIVVADQATPPTD